MLYFAMFIKVNMALLKDSPSLIGMVEGLKLDYPELGVLLNAVQQQATPYDFFRTLTTHLLPYIRREKIFKTLLNRWDRQNRAYQRNQERLKIQAIKEVSTAVKQLSERLENNPKFKTPEVIEALEKANGYLNGTISTFTPSHYESAAESLTSACRQLLQQNGHELLEGIAELTSAKEYQEIDGIWQSVDVSGIKRCHFYGTISTIIDERMKWKWDSFDLPHVCWSYLRLAEKCWDLTEQDFKSESLKNKTIADCERSIELLGLHGYWVELQSIRNKRYDDPPFFTIERFSKYLEVIASAILFQTKRGTPTKVSLGLYALTLQLDGDYLLLVVEKTHKRNKTLYLLHTFNGASDPRNFLNQLLANPGKEITPADVGMNSNSSPNMLARAKLTGPLKDLFFRKGQRKGSVMLTSPRIELKNQELAVQLNIEQQLDEMNLKIHQESITVNI